jgi:hypothetical protein
MSREAMDLKGRQFENLTVLKRAESDFGRQPKWICECVCGNVCIVQGRYLKSGATKSCGCMQRGAKRGEMSERDMYSPSDSLYRLQTDGIPPYHNLANAIVCVAADDYRTALKQEDSELMGSLEEFFSSDWFRILSRINPVELVRLLRKEHSSGLTTVFVL